MGKKIKNIIFEVGDIVQLNEDHDFAPFCFAQISEVKVWGFIAVIKLPNCQDAPIRLLFNDIFAEVWKR